MTIRIIEGLKKRLKRDSDLHTKYTEQMEAVISKGCAEAFLETKSCQTNARDIFLIIR